MTTTEATTRLPILDEAGRALLFTDARTANAFSPDPVPDETLAELWELAKWPPTAVNSQPMRVVFVRTQEGKARLVPLLNEGNRAKSEQAPVNAVLAADLDFHEHAPEVAPHRPELRAVLEARGRAGREQQARTNATLQAGYFLLAARAVGLATGPMGGFDAGAVAAEFFPEGRLAPILVVNLGHPAPGAYRPRATRLAGEHTISWV